MDNFLFLFETDRYSGSKEMYKYIEKYRYE